MTKQHKAELRDFNRAMLWQWDRLRGLTPAERVEGHKLRIQPMPTKREIYELVRAVKQDISNEYRATNEPDDEIPGIQLTVATNYDNSKWSYQTGDNSYTGGAYLLPHWAVVEVYRSSNCREIANDIFDQWADLINP